MSELKIVEEAKKPLSMNPKKFALWLFIVSVCMIFASLTSAYIVRQAEGNWQVFDLPPLFWVSSVLILVSSFTMHWAYISAKKDNLEMVKVGMSLTTVLGIAFLVTQIMAWNELVANNVYFTGGNPSASFVYVLSGMHGLHIVGGVVFLLITLVATFRFQVHSKNLNLIEMCSTFWHFLDALWLYLFLFLLFNR